MIRYLAELGKIDIGRRQACASLRDAALPRPWTGGPRWLTGGGCTVVEFHTAYSVTERLFLSTPRLLEGYCYIPVSSNLLLLLPFHSPITSTLPPAETHLPSSPSANVSDSQRSTSPSHRHLLYHYYFITPQNPLPPSIRPSPSLPPACL